MGSYNQIRKELNSIKIIDSHEHLIENQYSNIDNKDILSMYVLHFLQWDLLSAGMNENQLNTVADSDVPLEIRLKIAKPFLASCANRAYGRGFRKVLKDLHNIDTISLKSFEYLQQQYEHNDDSDYLFNFLREKCNIEKALLDDNCVDRFCGDRRIFKRVWHPEKYVKPGPVSGEIFKWVEGHYTKIENLDDWVTSFDEELDEIGNHGIKVLKIDLSRQRSLRFEDVSYHVAKESFQTMLNRWEEDGRGSRDHIEFPVEVQDFMLNRVLSSLRGRNAVVQFNTGKQQTNRSHTDDANPKHLNNLFEHYEDVRFDILNIGWPWWRDTIAFVKMFPNVNINFARTHMVSPTSATQCLKEAIDTIPLTKIIGFGGDYLFPDAVYAQVEIAKDNIANALSYHVDFGAMTIIQAMDIANAILYDNPKKLYCL